MPRLRNGSLVRAFTLAVSILGTAAPPVTASWSWVDRTPAVEGTALGVVAVAPSAPAVLYAARSVVLGGMVKSVDGGRTWITIDQGLGLAELEIYPAGLVSVAAIAVRPADPDVVYLGGGGSAIAGVFRTTSGGATWRPFGGPRASDGTFAVVSSLAIDPRRPSLMYAGTASGLFRSQDEGRTWTPLTEGLLDDAGKPRPVSQVVIEPGEPDTVWVRASDRLFRSRNRGASWAAREAGLPASRRLHDLVFSTATGAGYLSLGSSGLPAVWRTTNRGASWQPTGTGLRQGGNIAVMPGAPDALLYSLFAQVPQLAYSLDAGASWSESPSVASFPSRGVASGDAWVLLGLGAQRSEDRGATFVASNRGLLPNPSELAVEPESGTVLASFGQRLYRSTDQGAGFDPVDPEIAASGTQPFSVSRTSPTTVDVLAERLDGSDFGLYRSLDGGATFEPRELDATAFGNSFFPLLLASLGGDPERLVCGELGGAPEIADAGLYRSLDGGLTWAKSYDPPDDGLLIFQPQTAAADPTSKGRLFVGVHWRHTAAFSEGVVLRSRAGGAAFDVVLDGISFPQVAVGAAGSAGRRGVVYAGGGSGSIRQGLWRSLDQGTTWERLAGGLPEGDGHSIIAVLADPAVRGRVWAVIDALPWVSRNDGDTWTPVNATGLPYGFRIIGNRPLAIDPGVAGERPALLWTKTNLGLFSLDVTTDP